MGVKNLSSDRYKWKQYVVMRKAHQVWSMIRRRSPYLKEILLNMVVTVHNNEYTPPSHCPTTSVQSPPLLHCSARLRYIYNWKGVYRCLLTGIYIRWQPITGRIIPPHELAVCCQNIGNRVQIHAVGSDHVCTRSLQFDC